MKHKREARRRGLTYLDYADGIERWEDTAGNVWRYSLDFKSWRAS